MHGQQNNLDDTVDRFTRRLTILGTEVDRVTEMTTTLFLVSPTITVKLLLIPPRRKPSVILRAATSTILITLKTRKKITPVPGLPISTWLRTRPRSTGSRKDALLLRTPSLATNGPMLLLTLRVITRHLSLCTKVPEN